MKKKLLIVIPIIMIFALMGSCSAAPTEEPVVEEVKDAPRVAFLISDAMGPFEEDIWNWITKAEEEGFASETKLVEMQDPLEYEQDFRQVSEQGYDIVVSEYFFVKDPMNAVAPDFPDTNFVLIYETNENDLSNMRGILYNVQEGSYVCGVVAGLMTETAQVGFVGGDNSPGIVKFLAGYEAGIKSVNPDANLNITFAGTFIDPDKGHEMALALSGRDNDVVMHAANMTGLGVFTAAEEEGFYAIGVDVDQSDLAPENVICSALANPGASVYAAILDVYNNEWTGGTVNWGIDTGVPAVAFGSIVPDDVKAAAQEAEEKIASGEIVPPTETETE